MFALVGLACGLLSAVTACSDKPRLESAVIQAKQIYDQRDKETDSPPDAFVKKFNRRERRQFTDDMEKVVNSSYRDEALYSLGWFGERKHARAIAPHLGSDDRDTRRVAFNSFSRLVDREFENPAAARKWWQQEKASFPSTQEKKGFDWFGLAPKKTPGRP